MSMFCQNDHPCQHSLRGQGETTVPPHRRPIIKSDQRRITDMKNTNHNRCSRNTQTATAILLLAIMIAIITLVPGITAEGESAYDRSQESGLDSTLPENESTVSLSASDVIYVQHDGNGRDIYLHASQGETTTVYQIVNAKLSAARQWTESGLYIAASGSNCCATAPDDYISVKEGEVYFFRLFGLHDDYTDENGEVLSRVTPVLFMDENGHAVGSALGGTYTDGEAGVECVVPVGATRMHITYANLHAFSIQKKLTADAEQFRAIKARQEALLSSLDENYDAYGKDPVVYDEFDRAYITFVYEGIHDDIDVFADLFISKSAPLCYATSSENLLNAASGMTETRLDTALRIQESGGEILSQNDEVATADKINDPGFMYAFFPASRQKLMNMGLDVNGILLTGGNGQVTGSPATAKWVYSTYLYSDQYGEPYNGMEGSSSVYHRWGGPALYDFNGSAQETEAYIDQLIRNRDWAVLSFQGSSDISAEALGEVLDYIKRKGDDIEIVTYDTMYRRFAKRETVIKNTSKTYYVSADGTGRDGTDRNDPINLDTLNAKRIKSGDTVLFKAGDTFLGSVHPMIVYTNDEMITVSGYGEGPRPTICAYKYVENSWEEYSGHVYRIDIRDENQYTGYNDPDPGAFNIGFIEDGSGNKYYHKKHSIDQLTEAFDFYSDGERYLYMRSDRNPYEMVGGLKLAVDTKLFILASNMDISGLRFAYTGGHALQIGGDAARNVRISNCIIEEIGGSYLDPEYDERFGNGIEFYASDAENIEISDNIIRNVYDVAFTIQGDTGSGKDVYVHDNVFVNNAQDSEIWEGNAAAGVHNYQFYRNISINQGRGWGYDARPDQDAAAHILFYEYYPAAADIRFHHNFVYNPRRVYAIKPSMEGFFTGNSVKSDDNTYWLAEDARIFNYIYPSWEKDEFIAWAHKEDHSSFIPLGAINPDFMNLACTSDDIDSIRAAFEAIIGE